MKSQYIDVFFVDAIMEFRTPMTFAPPGERVRIGGKKCIIESRIGPYQGVISSMNKNKIYTTDLILYIYNFKIYICYYKRKILYKGYI